MKNVLILGAKSDIAQAIARELAAQSCNLMLAGRNPDSMNDLAADLRIRSGADVTAMEFDALDYGSHKAFYESLPHQPDTVICVFGYLGDAQTARTDCSEARRIMETNYNGAVSILDIAAADFEARGEGTLIGISSVAGDRGRGSNYHYGSAKAGFSAYLSGLRNHLAEKGVHVMTVKPGFVRTRMTEELALPGVLTASPEQVARAVVLAARKKRNVIYTLWMWRFIMLIIRLIPESIFKKMKL